MKPLRPLITLCLLAALALTGCGDADDYGIGAQCSKNEDCTEEGQSCLTQFKGGYCGTVGCTSSAQCPDKSACVTHVDGKNYCFRVCTDKAQCNENRDATWESNCSANIVFASGQKEGKACIPPAN